MLTVDSNEARQEELVYRLEHLLPLEVEVKHLDSADFASLESPLTLGVERKSLGNLAMSLVSNELDEQLSTLVESYDLPVLLIEGMPTPNMEGKFHVYGAGKDYSYNWFMAELGAWFGRGVWPLMVNNILATPHAIVSLYKMAQKEEHREYFEPKKVIPNLSPYSLVEKVMLQFPGVGPERVKQFKGESLSNLSELSENAWQEKLGKATGRKVWQAWHQAQSR